MSTDQEKLTAVLVICTVLFGISAWWLMNVLLHLGREYVRLAHHVQRFFKEFTAR